MTPIKQGGSRRVGSIKPQGAPVPTGGHDPLSNASPNASPATPVHPPTTQQTIGTTKNLAVRRAGNR